ncbi:hypothetical protein DVR12_25330 [Chitinophaga silvatica]|uniref:Uncharacterized protein n=1 Tax=Chitinophaga silvatica TaxID=2282649 RepID=A0A3E1Y395_9BACT|nr:hypothetical protein [Chitinophaga silvatica]RFS19124.1 hypothetical protein DVR12_25290 [Chitinophaga silvatica]RFS19131.1 hypothetical protein DVR12_25330 [Chitinophaga silvatica]
MMEIFSLQYPLKKEGFEIEPFTLERGAIYKVIGPFQLQQYLLGRAYKKHFSLHGKAKVIYSHRAEGFRWKNVRFLLEKRRGASVADFFMQSLNLPDDTTIDNLSGTSSINLFNFELNYDRFDLFYFIELGYDPVGTDLLYQYMRLRINQDKCFIVQDVWATGKELDKITLTKL